MRNASLLGSALALALALGAVGLDTAGAVSPPPVTVVNCYSCSVPVVIPAGQLRTMGTYDTLAEAEAVFDDDAALNALTDRWIESMVANRRCANCPSSTVTCPRTVHSDDPSASDCDLYENADGTYSISIRFDDDFWIWICCGECSS